MRVHVPRTRERTVISLKMREKIHLIIPMNLKTYRYEQASTFLGTGTRNPLRVPVPRNPGTHGGWPQNERKNISKHSIMFKNMKNEFSTGFPFFRERNPEERELRHPYLKYRVYHHL